MHYFFFEGFDSKWHPKSGYCLVIYSRTGIKVILDLTRLWLEGLYRPGKLWGNIEPLKEDNTKSDTNSCTLMDLLQSGNP